MKFRNLILVLIVSGFFVSCEENAESSLSVQLPPTSETNETTSGSNGDETESSSGYNGDSSNESVSGNSSSNDSNGSNSGYSSGSSNDSGSGDSSDSNDTPPAPSNNLPTTSGSTESIERNTLLSSTLSGLDSDSDALTYSVVSNPSNGSVNITNSSTGEYEYTPSSNYEGLDSFTFKVNDGTGDSNISTVSITITSPFCPTNFLRVNGNTTYSTSDFCIAKYESRYDGSVIITGEGSPFEATPAAGFVHCSNYTESGFDGEFAMVSNDEWMTAATEIAQNDNNWSGTGFGDGYINRGWSMSNNSFYGTGDTATNNATAPNSLDSCKYNTGANTCAATGDFKFKRTHYLSSGEEVWDMSGNALEVVDTDPNTSGLNGITYGCGIPYAWRELSDLGCAGIPNSLFDPKLGIDSTNGIGKIWATANGPYFTRGGSSIGEAAGIFSAMPVTSSSLRGFRCVYRP